jgi:hypothetical protein
LICSQIGTLFYGPSLSPIIDYPNPATREPLNIQIRQLFKRLLSGGALRPDRQPGHYCGVAPVGTSVAVSILRKARNALPMFHLLNSARRGIVTITALFKKIKVSKGDWKRVSVART